VIWADFQGDWNEEKKNFKSKIQVALGPGKEASITITMHDYIIGIY
jgi:hypothetical protein